MKLYLVANGKTLKTTILIIIANGMKKKLKAIW